MSSLWRYYPKRRRECANIAAFVRSFHFAYVLTRPAIEANTAIDLTLWHMDYESTKAASESMTGTANWNLLELITKSIYYNLTKPNRLFFFALLLSVNTSCTEESKHSIPLGHFENMSEGEVLKLLEKRPQAVAEYEPTESVLVSDDIAESMNLPYRALEAAILDSGVRLIIAGPKYTGRPWTSSQRTDLKKLNAYSIRTQRVKEDPESIWARDWAPIMAKASDGSGILLDFNYIISRPRADKYGEFLSSKVFVSAKRLSVPLFLEGGNFQVNSKGYCIVSERILGDNEERALNMYAVDTNGIIIDGDSLSTDQRGLDYAAGTAYMDVDGNWRLRTEERFYNEVEIRKILDEYAGCRETLIVPSMPHEPTRHVDVFLKFIDDQTILLSQLDSNRVENLAAGRQKEIALKMLEHQSVISQMLKSEGFSVVQVPMPLPHIPVTELEDDIVVRSYVNSLLIVSRDQKKTVIVPSFQRGRFHPDYADAPIVYPYVDEEHIEADEAKVKKIYEDFDYNVKFVNADSLVGDFGAIHCTTMQYPAL